MNVDLTPTLGPDEFEKSFSMIYFHVPHALKREEDTFKILYARGPVSQQFRQAIERLAAANELNIIQELPVEEAPRGLFEKLNDCQESLVYLLIQ